MNITRIASAAELDAALARGSGVLEMAIDLPVAVNSGYWTISCAPGFRAKVKARGNANVEISGDCSVEAAEFASIVASGNSRVVAREKATVEARENCRVQAYGSSGIVAFGTAGVIALERSCVELWENATVEAWDSCYVVAWGNSVAVARGSSMVEARERSEVRARETSRIVCREQSTVDAGESSVVEAWENSSVVARESCSVEARGNASVEAWGNCNVVARDSSCIVARGNICVRLYGARKVLASSQTVIMMYGKAAEISGGRQIAAGYPRTALQWCELNGVRMHDGVAILFQCVDADFSTEEARRAGLSYAPGTIPCWSNGELSNVLRAAPHPRMARADLNPGGIRAVACPVRLEDMVVDPDFGYDTSVMFGRCCAAIYEVDWDGGRLPDGSNDVAGSV
jgi:hypothetical protein